MFLIKPHPPRKRGTFPKGEGLKQRKTKRRKEKDDEKDFY